MLIGAADYTCACVASLIAGSNFLLFEGEEEGFFVKQLIDLDQISLLLIIHKQSSFESANLSIEFHHLTDLTAKFARFDQMGVKLGVSFVREQHPTDVPVALRAQQVGRRS